MRTEQHVSEEVKAHPIGATVRLKSGGPVMTVVGPQCEVLRGNQECTWFDDAGAVKEDNFPTAALAQVVKRAGTWCEVDT